LKEGTDFHASCMSIVNHLNDREKLWQQQKKKENRPKKGSKIACICAFEIFCFLCFWGAKGPTMDKLIWVIHHQPNIAWLGLPWVLSSTNQTNYGRLWFNYAPSTFAKPFPAQVIYVYSTCTTVQSSALFLVLTPLENLL